MSDLLTAMSDAWHTPAKLSVLLNQSPSATRAALKRLQERGQVRYRAETDEFQVYPVRQSLREFVNHNPGLEFNAKAVADACMPLGLSWEQAHALPTDLARSGEIECWFGSHTQDAPHAQD